MLSIQDMQFFQIKLTPYNNQNKMDPRPYHFDYRRPRPTNPTYQSKNFYGSIVESSNKPASSQISSKNPQQNNSNNTNKSTIPQMKRANSTDIKSSNKIDFSNGLSSYRYSRPNLENTRKINNSNLSYMGTNFLNSSIDQRTVYQKQEKQFNIISCFPRNFRTSIKQYPKLTLEDKLFEHPSNSQKKNSQT